MNKFLTANKWLTRYALSCGYVEVSRSAHDDDVHVFLLQEHTVLHVKGCGFWESFNSITEARKYFMTKTRELNLKRVVPKK